MISEVYPRRVIITRKRSRRHDVLIACLSVLNYNNNNIFKATFRSKLQRNFDRVKTIKEQQGKKWKSGTVYESKDYILIFLFIFLISRIVFVYNRTDFYRIMKTEHDKLGFPPGVAMKLLLNVCQLTVFEFVQKLVFACFARKLMS